MIFVLGIVILIVGPLASFVAFAVGQGKEGVQYLADTLRGDGAREFVDRLPDSLSRLGHEGLEQLGEPGEDIGPLLQKHMSTQGRAAAAAVGTTLSVTGSFIFTTVMMLIAFYFFLVQGAEAIAWLDDLSPLARGQTQELLTEFRKVSLAVLVSQIVTSTVQAAAALGGYLLTGVPYPVFFAGITFIAAFIPAVGAGSVCVVAALMLFLAGHPHAALFLALWGLIVVGLSDNLIKPWLIKGNIQMNSGVIFFALIGGLAAFGGVGLLVGPLVVALFLSLLRMYRRDFRPPRSSRAPAPEAAAG